ncbi:glycosyl hydrolase family 32 [Ruminococcus sp. AF41-9]|nr:glycosyl hydrolase family 32 [Ruminococcus sp. AF41-9]
MSTLTKVLERNVAAIEKNADMTEGRFRLGHHLMPPVGWLNDPNGLCWYKGKYHVFFQYAPFDVEGGLKFWGHYTSEDMIDWKYEGTALYPDSSYDCHGVYSGSALVDDGKLHLFFTGNVKIDGDYDYINEGRETSTLHVESEDGIHFSNKEEVISFSEYPEEFTCHIRDPKVWKENGKYFMVLGGRLKGDKGAVLVYESGDLKEWKLLRTITTPEVFGYMWECPDYFELDGEKILSVSPQGLTREEFRFQNIYQSGYFILKEDGSVDVKDFREWDMGFDFYAPQTFTDVQGRRILIGWMGMPDADEEYVNKTIEEGWQHCLTVPRELKLKDGKILQYPVKELENLRKEKTVLNDENSAVELRVEVNEGFDLVLEEIALTGSSFQISMGGQMLFRYENGTAEIGFPGVTGAGRKVRKAQINELRNIRFLVDTSAAEIYLNDGETVFSTRYYPDREDLLLKIQGGKFKGNLWNLRRMRFTK